MVEVIIYELNRKFRSARWPVRAHTGLPVPSTKLDAKKKKTIDAHLEKCSDDFILVLTTEEIITIPVDCLPFRRAVTFKWGYRYVLILYNFNYFWRVKIFSFFIERYFTLKPMKNYETFAQCTHLLTRETF